MIKDMYVFYPEKRNEIADVLSEYLRPITPNEFKAEAMVKYPKLDFRSAISLYAEDVVVAELNLKHAREIVDGKVIKVALS